MAAPLTFLFTDLENSTSLWQQAPQAMAAALARHDAIMGAAVENHHGRIVKSTGDGILAVFDSAGDGVLAALSGQQAMSAESWPAATGPLKVRMGLHTGESQERAGDYYGSTVNAAARIMDMGHGGQVLLSEVTVVLLRSHQPAAVTFSELGAHRLKGFARPEVIYQLCHPDLVADFPPLKSLSVPKHNLPGQTTPFVGRQSELTALSELFLAPQVRLVTIVAPGGSGKTRLALEVGRQMVPEFKNGVYLVELAPLGDAGQIAPAVAEALDYQPQPDSRSLNRQVEDYLRDKEILLLMDNFEHLAGDGAGMVTALLQAASRLKILVTSRQRLFQPGETLFTLSGLTLPAAGTLDDASGNAAVALFQQTAQRARPDFGLTDENLVDVIDICRLVQGMPLGIVLAAPWVTVLSPAEIAAELQQGLDILETEGSELPQRQRSMRVVFDQAWSMMSAPEQQVFMKLAVFRGGFTREAGQVVAGARLPQLQSLVNKAFIEREADSGRYRIHELLRQYAEENLRQLGQEPQARDDHTHYYLTYLAKQAAGLKGNQQLAALARIEADFENIRQGWQDAISNRQYDLLHQALEAIYLFCFLQSRLEDGRALFDSARQGLAPEPGQAPHPVWLAMAIRFYSADEDQALLLARLENSLALARDRDDPLEAAYCLRTLASLAHYVEQNPPRAIAYYEECAAIYRQLDEKYYLAQTLSNMGEAHQLMGQTDLTLQYVNEAYQLQREIGDRMGESETLRALSMTSFQIGHYDEMVDLQEKAYAIQLQTNYRVGQATANLYMGSFAFWRGEFVEGRVVVQQGLDLALEVVDSSTQAWCYAMLSMIDGVTGDYARAEQEVLQAEAIETDPFRQTGGGNPFLQALINLARFILNAGVGNFEVARSHLIQPFNLALMTSSQPFMPWLLGMAAIIYAHEGRSAPAVELLGLVLTQPVNINNGYLKQWPLLSHVQSELQDELGQAAFAAAWERGQSLDLKSAAEEALQEIESSNEGAPENT